MSYVSLAGIQKEKWTEAHWSLLLSLTEKDSRVKLFIREDSKKDPLGKGRPVASIQADLGRGEALIGIFSVGAICNKLNKCDWQIEEGIIRNEENRIRRAEEQKQYEQNLLDELEAVFRRYGTTMSMVRAVVNRMIRGYRIPEDRHWQNAQDCLSEGMGGSWAKIKEYDRLCKVSSS